MIRILVIHGPNLNMLGTREPGIYGTTTMQSINDELANKGLELGFQINFFQSNSEGAIIDRLHSAHSSYQGVILNAGAYTHYSYAIRDAISAISPPVIEVHISNVHAREDFRKTSVIAPVCRGTIAGFGTLSYTLALDALSKMLV